MEGVSQQLVLCGQPYLLIYEDGQNMNFLPGTNEIFTLQRYHEESGIDYNRINLYLCTMEDHNHMLMAEFDSVLMKHRLHINALKLTRSLYSKMMNRMNKSSQMKSLQGNSKAILVGQM